MPQMALVLMATSLKSVTQRGLKQPLNSQFFLQPLPARPSKAVFSTKPKSRPWLEVHASMKEKAVTRLAAAALTVSMLIPEVAEAAAGSGITPSLKNFLLSIVGGGVVLGVLVGAVIGVANFDPVKRS